jgi:hypothetical protein
VVPEYSVIMEWVGLSSEKPAGTLVRRFCGVEMTLSGSGG